jgi:FkbM family methyltransferase
VHCFKLALGAESGHETIFLNEMAAKNSLSPEWSDAIGTETAEVFTVDQVMAAQGIELIHFLKIDTEGYELKA